VHSLARTLRHVAILSLATAACGDNPSGPGGASPFEPDTLPVPDLTVSHDYVGYVEGQPRHFTDPAFPFDVIATSDNTPADNRVTNAGATLGRVLFYDVRLSVNNTVSCASCHRQLSAFSDPRRFSVGWDGEETERNAPSLTNARFYFGGRTFLDERVESLEAQALEPITSEIEMGMPSVDSAASKLSKQPFYPPLFEAAFGDPTVTPDRIARAIAQFERALTSYEARHDEALAATELDAPFPDFLSVYDEREMRGLAIFQPVPLETQIEAGIATSEDDRVETWGCSQCHQTAAQILSVAPGASSTTRDPELGVPSGPGAVNTGLDPSGTGDPGVLDLDSTLEGVRGAFKVPSLRNVAVTGPYMHDGRFGNLADVIRFYAEEVLDQPETSRFLREGAEPGAPVRRFEGTDENVGAVIAFLRTLSDVDFLTNPMFSDPFR